jgi:hypothetical protein
MRTSEKTGELAKSLFAFQRDLKPPRTDSTADTGKFSYDYLSLPGLLAHCRQLLTEWGLVVLQEGGELHGGVGITTRVIHAPSGEWIELGPLFLPAQGSPQNFGSAYTYGRRYAFAAALGIAADNDDDAASASSPARSQELASTSGRDGAENRGEGAEDFGEGSKASSPPLETPSSQSEGHHDHHWVKSPTLQGWEYCDVHGCGKARRASLVRPA